MSRIRRLVAMKERISCFKCKHFYVTWDKKFPRGCRFFGFKGRNMPCNEVAGSSGQRCKAFSEK